MKREPVVVGDQVDSDTKVAETIQNNRGKMISIPVRIYHLYGFSQALATARLKIIVYFILDT